jgi:hypothetical protein
MDAVPADASSVNTDTHAAYAAPGERDDAGTA